VNIPEMQAAIHKTALEHGWWEPQPDHSLTKEIPTKDNSDIKITPLVQRSFGDLIALMHTELSEALEAYRKCGLEKWFIYQREPVRHLSQDELHKMMVDEGLAKPEGAFVELADCIIRILDAAGFYGVDMEELILEKMKYNETRPYRHGNKAL